MNVKNKVSGIEILHEGVQQMRKFAVRGKWYSASWVFFFFFHRPSINMLMWG